MSETSVVDEDDSNREPERAGVEPAFGKRRLLWLCVNLSINGIDNVIVSCLFSQREVC